MISKCLWIWGVTECLSSWWDSSFAKRLRRVLNQLCGGGMGNVYLNIWYHSLFFVGRMEMKREFHSRTKAFACILTMCAGFSDAYTFICRGGTLAAGQTGNVVFLSVGLIGQQISDVEVKLATMLAFMLGIFLMTVLRRLIDNSVWRLSTLVPFILTTLVTGFLPASVKNVFIVPFLAWVWES